MTSFSIELVSNASMNVFPNNTLASFTNVFPEEISLDSDWEVCLSEITYPCFYYNIKDGHFEFDADTRDELTPWRKYKYKIDAGMYSSLSEIANAMNSKIMVYNNLKIDKNSIPVSFTLNPRTYHVNLELFSKFASLTFKSKDLSNILGFQCDTAYTDEKEHQSLYPVDISRIHSVLVYTDIIEHDIVGDTRAPLLRSFPFINRLRNMEISALQPVKRDTFENSQFRKLLKKSFHSIHIELRTPSGEMFPFAGIGLTRLTLTFRKNIH